MSCDCHHESNRVLRIAMTLFSQRSSTLEYVVRLPYRPVAEEGAVDSSDLFCIDVRPTSLASF